MFRWLRSILFFLVCYISGMLYGVTGVLLAFLLPTSIAKRYINHWNHLTIGLLRRICGIDIKLIGAEHVPNQPCVIVSKHQSALETFYLQTLFAPLSTILKKELLNIPFFGWGLRVLEPIAIDRDKPKEALKQIQKEGVERLQHGQYVLIFPEGTRIPVGESGRYARSGADLAKTAGVPILPVAHNAGSHWLNKSLLKIPGTVTFSIGAAIDTNGRHSKEIMAEAEAWIEAESKRLLSH